MDFFFKKVAFCSLRWRKQSIIKGGDPLINLQNAYLAVESITLMIFNKFVTFDVVLFSSNFKIHFYVEYHNFSEDGPQVFNDMDIRVPPQTWAYPLSTRQ